MADRYHGGYAPPGRSSTFSNPARSSMPTMPSMPSMPPMPSMPSSVGYSSLYAGDMHVMPASSTRAPLTTAQRGYATSTAANGVPTTTRTYAVSRDPRHGSGVSREPGHRRSTLDSAPRPPIIVTTAQGGSHQPSHSPVRNAGPRASDGHLYALPASSIRSRSSQRPYHHRHTESDDYSRARELERERELTDAALAARDAELYRSSRPSVVYPSDPRHSTASVNYGDDGYQYTNAGELARYDLDHTRPSRSRRKESLDRGYYRPNVSYNTDQRSFNINTSGDLSRNYSMNTSRPYEGPSRGGPPPSTRGFDRIDRSFDSARDVPPAAPVPPSPTISRPGQSAAGAADSRDGRRGRPVSLYQDGPPRSSHHEDYYRSQEDERNMRELRDRDRESERLHESPRFQDESVTTRGFGIRTTAPVDDYDDRRDRHREPRKDDPRKRSDEEVTRDTDLDRERRRHVWTGGKDEPRRRSDEDLPREPNLDRERHSRHPDDRNEPRRRSDEDLSAESEQDRERRRRARVDDEEDPRESRESNADRSRVRDKLAAGTGIAAAAIGLTPGSKDEEDREDDIKESRRRRSPMKDRDPRDEAGVDRPRADEGDRHAERPMGRDYERDRYDAVEGAERKERHRRAAEDSHHTEAVASGSDSDRDHKSLHRSHQSIGFNPNDASDISKLREQLASMGTSDKGKEPVSREREREPSPRESAEREPVPSDSTPAIIETRSQSPPGDRRSLESQRDDSRSREVSLREEKMVRVVSPPRERKEDKPLRGILKQPRVSFPEEESYIREGVAPHKEDKKTKEVPPDARWTKISRKVVNPEALTVGKERFEVRDDFVIVLRVLSKEEIQAYAAATQVLRERRRNRDRDDDKQDDDDDQNRDRDDGEGRRRRRRRRNRDEEFEAEDLGRDRDRDRDRDRERDYDRGSRRRHRRADDDYDDYDRRAAPDSERDHHHHHHSSRSYRDRDRLVAEV